MHAIVVRVRVDDLGGAQARLRADVAPRVAQLDGFVAAYWLEPVDGHGMSVIVFDSEEAAHKAADGLQPPDGVTLESVEVRAVVASA